MEISIPVWNFSLVYQVKISSRLKSKLHFKMTLQLHVKISILYTELKFQFVLTNRRWNVNQTWKFQVFHIIVIFSNPGWKFDTENARIFFFFFKKKIKMGSWQARFKWTDDKLISLIKCKNSKVPWDSEIAIQSPI